MLEQKIYQDYVIAMKQKDKKLSTFLSFIRSSLKNTAIDLKKNGLSDEEVLSVLKKEQKRLGDTLESIGKSDRGDLLEAANFELAVLNRYLPQKLSQEELDILIAEALKETQAASMKDMGKVMQYIIGKAGLRADAKTLSALVKEKLSLL